MKTDFESTIYHEGYRQYIVVDAVAHNGSVLARGTSTVIEVPLVDEDDVEIDDDMYMDEESASMLSILSNPIFIASFVVTVAIAAIGAGWWAFRSRWRRRQGERQESGLVDVFRKRWDRVFLKRYDDGGDGRSPLMNTDGDWRDEVDLGKGGEDT